MAWAQVILCGVAFVASCGVATAQTSWQHVQPVPPPQNATRLLYIADEYNRETTFRGANVEHEERNLPPWQRSTNPADYNGTCPQNYMQFQEPPICEVAAGSGKFNQSTADQSMNDLAQLRAFGFNALRLCLSWSELEYEPGNYNVSYIDRVEQIVDWAEEQGAYVLLDMHQDLYSRSLLGEGEGIPPYLVPANGSDGAPAWAVLTDGWPSWGLKGIGNINPALFRASTHLYNNTVPPGVPQGAAPGPGLQDHYIGAIAALARRFVNRSTVIGYEIMNEPNPTASGIIGFEMGRVLFDRFYARVIQALTGIRDGKPTCATTFPIDEACAYPDLGIHDTRHIFFCEPSALRNQFDFSPEIAEPFTTFTNVVYSPHVYTDEFTIWHPPSFDFAYETATREARGRRGALFVTEFGGGYQTDAQNLVPTLNGQDKYLVTGATVWSWKSNCYSGNTTGCNTSSWTVFDPAPGPAEGPIGPNGNLRAERERVLSRVHMRGVVGPASAYLFNTTDQTFFLHVGVAAATSALSSRQPEVHVELAPTLESSPRVITLSAATPAHVIAAVDREIASNGSVTQIYIPRGVAWNVTVTGAAALSQIVTWPDGSRSAVIAPTLPLRAYTVAVGPPGWVPPPPLAAESIPEWEVSSVLKAAKARLTETGALRHGLEWCANPPSDWAPIKERLDALVARDPDAALVRLINAAGANGVGAGTAMETDPVAALVAYATAVAQLRDAVCGYPMQ